ncbi:MAG: SURF1 family protein [Sphingomonadales bacterium]
MKRLPIVATIVVALAVAAMIGLGVWQLRRAQWKEALIAQYADNPAKPPMAYPKVGPVPPEAMFRKSSANCLNIVGWHVEAGRSAAGGSGYRQIAECRTGAEGPGLLVDIGVSASPSANVDWRGGIVNGIITTEPDHSSLVAKLFGRAPVLRPMLVADTPAPGLSVSAPPSVEGITNNHRAYAVQWFIFATIAAVIYALALRRRFKP